MTQAERGKVYLVGAGPGDPELLTVRAVRLLGSADVVFHDDLVPAEVLALANRHALVTSVGKRCGRPRITQQGIHSLMIDAARAGQSVVRLKCGDPLVFGRAGEEIAALRAAGVEFEVVPGVTAAFAAGAALAIPLTDRKYASKLIFCTGHHATRQRCGVDVVRGVAGGCDAGDLHAGAGYGAARSRVARGRSCGRCAMCGGVAGGNAAADACGFAAGGVCGCGVRAGSAAGAGGESDGAVAGSGAAGW